MNLQPTIDGFNKTGLIPSSFVLELETNEDLKAELIAYFNNFQNRKFILALLESLIEMRKNAHHMISGDSMMLVCFLLGKHQQISDCMKIWEAKRTDFDTYCYIDIQLIAYGGLEQTISYLKTQTSQEAKFALDYILSCNEFNDFENLEEYFKNPWFI